MRSVASTAFIGAGVTVPMSLPTRVIDTSGHGSRVFVDVTRVVWSSLGEEYSFLNQSESPKPPTRSINALDAGCC